MKQRLLGIFMAVVLLLGSVPVTADAATTTKKANIRLVFTTDIHGQLTTTDYESGGEYTLGGLSRAYTLITKARSEKGASNTFTFDLGDSLYDYSTEYIYMADSDEIQPLYKAMATIGYDAITLGNHDFDYGFTYIKNQIKGAGLASKCVVSNVYDANTKKSIWKENLIISRKVKTTDGKTMTIKVGIVGETIPKLSTKTESYTAVLSTEDIVESVEKQAAALKKKGADVVVVLAHSGFGTEEPEYMDKNVSYALTKLSDVDVVLCGHNHINFPSTDSNAKSFYLLSGVNKTTGLVNGKNLVMATDRGKSIGIADFTIQKTGSTVKITNRKSEVRKVSDKKPSVNKSLNTDFMGKWATIFAETASNEIGTIKSGELLENYFGLLEDSKAIELVNEAKISYALNFTQVTNTAYKTYPVIAATRYKSYGQEDSGGYVSLSGDISEAELSKLQAYNGYINLYTITGAQLREWLEWTASAYATGGISDNTSNEYLSGNTLLFEAWQNDWGGAYIFDGIEYKINTLLPARYSSGGTKISDSYRITSLTRNGVEIKDTDRFVLAVDRLTGVYDVIKDVTNQTISTGYNRSQTLVMNYLASCYKNIEISTQVDNNWSLLLNPSITYRLEGGDGSESVATTKSWYRQTVGTLSGYYYYDAVFNNVSTDTSGPLVVLRSLNQLTTNKDVSVAVQATDSSGVKKISYLKGKYTSTTDSDWSRATIITGSTFAATDNGIYSVMAEDEQGNRRIAYITIENINRGTLQVPSVETYTNRKTKIAGTAEAGATIYFEVGDEKYQTTVGTDGKFSYALPSQTAGTEIITYVKDGSGKSSSRLSLLVKRTGPNYPQVQTLANNETKISGSINDTNVKPVLLVGSTAYVASTDVELFQESEIYADKYSIVKSNVTIDASGNFSITIPAQRANTSIKLYTIDSAGRASRVYKSTVEEVAPNKPSLYAVTNIEKTVYGYVSGASESKPCDIEVYVGSDKYTGTTDATGYFTVETGTLKKGTTIRVYATDTGENGQTRRSAAGTTTVKDINNYVSEEGALTFNKITDKVTTLKGSYDVGNETLFLKIGSDYTTVTTNSSGNFTIDLEEPLDVGTNIYAVARYEKAGVAEAGKIQVTKGKPFQPTIKNKTVYNTTVTVSVESEENCTLYALLDGKTYSSGKYVSYDEETGMYLYKITIPKTNSGKKLSVYAKNSAGKSPVAETTIVEKAPNKPKVDTVTTATTKITGSVHLILPLGTEDEEATVKNTGTKVYAKIGSKTYTAKVTDDGEFTIEIPKQKKGTKITVWGVNENGTGPKKSVTVK